MGYQLGDCDREHPYHPEHFPNDHDPPEKRGVTGGVRAWQVLLCGGFLLTLLYVVMPYGIVAGGLYVGASLAATAVVMGAVHRRSHLYCPRAWILMAGGLALMTVGHSFWYWFDLRDLEPFPSIADFFYLASYLLYIGAMWTLGRRSGQGSGALIDALIVGVSAAVLGWALLIAPYIDDPALGPLPSLVATTYPVADLILLPLVLHLLFRYGMGIAAHGFLLAGMLCLLAADILYAHGNLIGWYGPGGFTDSLWLVSYTLFATAVCHPSASVEPASRVNSAELPSRRLVLLAGAVLLVPAAILLTADTDIRTVRVAAIGSILLFVLVILRIVMLVDRIGRQNENLRNLVRTDPLTGTGNRRVLEEALVRESSRSERTGTNLSLVFLDLDHFKRYNDSQGHSAGDDVLRELVAAWKDELRPHDVLARFGGEEFVVVLPDTDSLYAQSVAERLRALVPRQQTCSAGVASYEIGEGIDAFVNRADRALYTAKECGRDQTVVADQTTNRHSDNYKYHHFQQASSSGRA